MLLESGTEAGFFESYRQLPGSFDTIFHRKFTTTRKMKSIGPQDMNNQLGEMAQSGR